MLRIYLIFFVTVGWLKYADRFFVKKLLERVPIMNKIKNVIMKKLKEKKVKNNTNKAEDDFFLSLGPANNADEDNIYYNRFRRALDNKCKLIAFTGPYGVGKTSIIDSIFRKKPFSKKKIIRVSLGNYKSKEQISKPNNSNDIAKEIELKILQQIVYTSYSNELPLSRFKRIKYFGRFSDALICIESFLILVYSWIILPGLYEWIFNKIVGICYSEYLIFLTSLFTYIMLFILIHFFLYNIKMAIDKISLKYKNLEVTFSNADSGSVFNKYLDEIVYFFEKTGTEIVVIEDLDRYDNVSMEVFKSLKELNFMLNANKNIKKRIVFVYAMRDDLFSTSEDRVKFFETIIPVVSTFSIQNCKEYLVECYEKLKKICEIKIDEKLFDILSMFVKDRRILANIFMEFKMYIDVLKNHQEVDDTRLFALIAYKNIRPNDFEERLRNKGNLYNIFELKKMIIEFLTSKIKEENTAIKDEIKNMEWQKLKDEKILKKAFLCDFLSDKYRSDNYYQFIMEDKEFSLDEVVDNIDIKLLLNGKIKYKRKYYSLEYDFDKELIKKYRTEMDRIHYDFNSQNDKIVLNNKKIEKYQEMSIQDLLNIDGVIGYLSISDNSKIIMENKLLLLLVKNGFIREDYEMILLYFISGELSNNDHGFMIMLGLEERIPFTYDLNNTEKMIVKIKEREFKSEKILNFKLCDELLKNSTSKKTSNFLSQFSDMNDNKLNFLDGYYEHDKNNFTNLIKSVLDDNLILYYFEHFSDLRFPQGFITQVIENIELHLFNDISKEKFKIALEKDYQLLNNLSMNEVCENNLKLLKPIYDNYDDISDSMIEFLYSSGIYIPNRSMFNRLCDVYCDNNISVEAEVLEILNEVFKPFLDKLVKSHTFIEFYNSFTEYKSSEDSVIETLNNNLLSLDEEKLILTKENLGLIKDINVIDDTELWDFIRENHLIEINMTNILAYYTLYGEVNEFINELLEDIGEDYKAINDDDFIEFENDLIYSKEDYLVDYDKIAKVFTHEIDSFDDEREINKKLVEMLIAENKVKLNVVIYNYFCDNAGDLLPKLVTKRFNDYLKILDNAEDAEPDYHVVMDAIDSDIDINIKKKIFNKIDFSYFKEKTNNKIVDEIIKNSIFLDDYIVENIFDNLTEKYKIKYFIYLHKQNSKNIWLLYRINNKISKIRDGSTTHLVFSETYLELMQYLEKEKIINKCEIDKDNKILISYSRSRIIEQDSERQ